MDLSMNRTDKLFFSDSISESRTWQEWFKLNNIECKNIKKYLETSVMQAITDKTQGNTAVIFLHSRHVHRLGLELLDKTADEVKDFLSKNKIVCAAGWYTEEKPYQNDLLYVLEKFYDDWIKISDLFIRHDYSIIFLGDGRPSTKMLRLKCFHFIMFNVEFFNYATPYVRYKINDPVNREKDFLFMCMKRDDRQHRDILLDLLTQKGMTNNAVTLSNPRNNRIKYKDLVRSYGEGIYAMEYTWYDRWPSVELYQQTHFEIVGETFGEMGNDAFFPTEKIVKPIVMCHPFVVAGSYKFLENLKSFGFKTFDTVIDESYDDEMDMTKRMNKVADCVQSILAMGSDKFYSQTRDICEHNYYTLIGLQGMWKTNLWRQFSMIMKDLI